MQYCGFFIPMMTLYGIPNCNTVKKARAWLEQHDIAYTFHDFRKNGISTELLEGWFQQVSWEKLLNRSGLTWRGLSDDDKNKVADSASAIVLMLSKPSVIKRPVLTINDSIALLGFSEAEYQQLSEQLK